MRACMRVCVCVCVCVVSVIVKRPVLPPSVVDGRSRNPLYYYYYYYKLYKQNKLGQKSSFQTFQSLVKQHYYLKVFLLRQHELFKAET